MIVRRRGGARDAVDWQTNEPVHSEEISLFDSAALAAAAVVLLLLAGAPRTAPAQDAPPSRLPVSRRAAVDSALRRGPRLGVARADSARAAARLVTARALLNPTLAAGYSKATPQYHVALELPLDYPWLRGGRIRSALAARLAARYRLEFERAAVALDADTAYTRALAALERARITRRNAQDADSLRRLAVVRRDAGDAADLDVELATLNAGQQANVAAADSLDALAALLDLQTVMGLAADRPAVVPTDTLGAPPAGDVGAVAPAATASVATPLDVAAAEQELAAAEYAARVQRRGVFTAPSVSAGFETRDPSGAERGILPTVGLSLPLPLLNRNRGAIAEAGAERERARSELELARLEAAARGARARRTLAGALARLARDRALVASAQRVAALSIVAYREGAASLPNVIEAQRNARDVLAQYVEDLASAWIAGAALRAFTLAAAPAPREGR